MTIAQGLIQKKFENGRWVLRFNDREAFLAGKYPDPPPDKNGFQRLEIQNLDGAQGDRSRADRADYGPRMQSMSVHTNNFFRFWVIAYFLFSKPEDLQPLDPAHPEKECDPIRSSVTSGGQLWRQRYCPFLLTDEIDPVSKQPKWDLNRFNQDYFFRLKRMIETALDYGIVVQLTLFDRTGIDYETSDHCLRWPQSPWRTENNINGLIVTSGKKDPGVNRFYQRNLPGVIRVLKPGHIHPGDDFSFDPDPDNYVEKPTTLGAIQDRYLHKVVSETMQYPNVVYEIMNEPIHKLPAPPDAEGIRANWANAVIPAIYSLTQGQRFIFYNDHTKILSPPDRGQDIKAWQAIPNSNFRMLDGVIFHGDVKEINPDALKWTFRDKLIIQVSSDTHTDETQAYNLQTTNNAFANHMMFQAEVNSDEAAQGIGGATPPPTLFNLPDFIGRWWKLPAQSTPNFFPHLAHVVNPDATVVDLNQDTDQFTMQGRIVGIGPGTLTSFNKLSGNTATFAVEFPEPEAVRPPVPLPNVILLQFTRDDIVQVFRKLDARDPLYRFYFKWERISVTPPDAPIPPFYMFIYPDRSLVTHRVADFVINNRATITNISPTQIFIHSATNNTDSIWNYRFANGDQQLTLEKADKSLTQVYRRLL